jgi:hypothetical protein
VESFQTLSGRNKHLVHSFGLHSGVLSFMVNNATPHLGALVDEGIITIKIEVCRAPRNARVRSALFFEALAGLGTQTRPIAPAYLEGNQNSLWVEMRVKAVPLSISRSTAIAEELKRVDQMARQLQSELPVQDEENLDKLYENVKSILLPVHPIHLDALNADGTIFQDWARETIDYLKGGLSVALATPSRVRRDAALAALAFGQKQWGKSLGMMREPSVTPKRLMEVAANAPGYVIADAAAITFSTNMYEMSNEISLLLKQLFAARSPVVFSGTYEDLQRLFHGGQGGANDPHFPVVRKAPDLPIETLILFGVKKASRDAGGLGRADEEGLVNKILSAAPDLAKLGRSECMIDPIITKEITEILSGTANSSSP